ncbi:MAG TPA: segregation/condensation protein A [Candidatus Nanoarchaeia archaeon]|nr:segregation/condensation protein A [Candidatus Nanoarchaeia archaeon]
MINNQEIVASSSDQIYNILMQEDEITWQTIIQDLVKSEQMNPWDIDLSLLSNRYLDTIKNLKTHNFFISGKVILASSILLRMKANKLLLEDIGNLDAQLFQQDVESLEEFEDPTLNEINPDDVDIIPRLPQPRKRKVSMQDLINALSKALDVSRRKIMRHERYNFVPEMEIPDRKIDITKRIKQLYDQIVNFFKKTLGKETLTFTKLVPGGNKEDKISTFIPLLYLDSQEKVDLSQKEHFGEIEIEINKNEKRE